MIGFVALGIVTLLWILTWETWTPRTRLTCRPRRLPAASATSSCSAPPPALSRGHAAAPLQARPVRTPPPVRG